jgi:uncharacterized membrane protein
VSRITPARRRAYTSRAFGVSIVVQIVLVILGVAYIVIPDAGASFAVLLSWCVLGTLYAIGVWTVLGAASRSAENDELPTVLELSRPARVISLIATVFASAVGVAATLQHIAQGDPSTDFDFFVELVGVWAMILAWMLLHWGFAQLYLQQYYREKEPPLRFPGDSAPGILEFAYFAYTVAVSLAASDVEVTDRRMRFRVLTHSVLSFFFNGLIIVIAFGAIAEAGALAL